MAQVPSSTEVKSPVLVILMFAVGAVPPSGAEARLMLPPGLTGEELKMGCGPVVMVNEPLVVPEGGTDAGTEFTNNCPVTVNGYVSIAAVEVVKFIFPIRTSGSGAPESPTNMMVPATLLEQDQEPVQTAGIFVGVRLAEL